MKMERPNFKKRENDDLLKQKAKFQPRRQQPESYTMPVLQIQDDAETYTESDQVSQDSYQEEDFYDRSQMSLGVENTNYKVKQKVAGYKSFFRRRKELLEFSPNWREPWLPLTVVFTIINFLLLSLGLIYLYTNKKTIEVPFIYDPVDRTWFRNDIVTVFLIALGYLLVSYVIIQLSGKITHFDRRLSAMINVMMFFINLLFNIGIIQIFLLIS